MNAFKKMFAPIDMTKGRPWENIFLFTIPMLLGNIAQQMYNTVDSVVVGNYVGDNALAAVGSVGPIINLMIVLFVGISIGASITVSQHRGAKRSEDMSKAVGNCILLVICAAIIICVLGILLARPLLILLNTPDSILEWCVQYMTIMFVGAVGMGMFNILSGVLRGLGDSMSALIFLLISTGINIVLDLTFVICFDMGVVGVALATVIAQGISALLCIWKLTQFKDIFEFNISYLKFSKRHAMDIIRLGVPSGIAQAMLSMAMLIVQSLTNTFGEQFIAANVIVMRVDGFAMLPNLSFGNAMTTYAGQNIGAKDLPRVSKGTKQGLLMGVLFSAAVTVVLILVGRPLMGIFTNTVEIVNMAYSLLQIMAVGYVVMTVTQILGGVMRGAGDTLTPMILSAITTIGVRVPMAYALVHLSKTAEIPAGNPQMIYVSLLLSWCVGATLHIIAYARGKWKNKAIR